VIALQTHLYTPCAQQGIPNLCASLDLDDDDSNTTVFTFDISTLETTDSSYIINVSLLNMSIFLQNFRSYCHISLDEKVQPLSCIKQLLSLIILFIPHKHQRMNNYLAILIRDMIQRVKKTRHRHGAWPT